jgi:hypothetical protein
VSTQGSSWLVGTVDVACQVKEDIAKSFSEGDKALMVHGGANKAGKFLEVAVFAEGGRKGGLWLPEGRDGRGWRHFAGELRHFLAPGGGLELSGFCSSSSAKALATKNAEAGVTGDSSKNRSFAEALQSKPRARVEAKNGGDDIRSMVDNMGRSVRAAGSGRKTRGRVDIGWVDELLGFAQLGLGRVVVGLLEGILDGPESLSVCNRVRAVLKRLKGSMGFEVGPFSLPTSTRHIYGQRKGKSGLKGVGIGWLTKRVRMKPSLRTKVHAVDLGLSSQQVCAGVEPPVPERGLGEALPLPVSTMDGGCLGASIGDQSSSGTVPFPPASSLTVTMAAFPLGKEREGRLGASEEGFSLGADMLKDSEPTIPVHSQTSSVVTHSLGREDSAPAPMLGEAPAEFVRNSAPVMGFLRRGFFGPRTPSASSSLDCKDAPVKDKGLSAPGNGMICRGFFGSSPASSKILVVTQEYSFSPKAPPSEASVSLSQLAYSRRVKEKVAK